MSKKLFFAFLAIAAMAVAPAGARGQAGQKVQAGQPGVKKQWIPPKTPWGDPDLQGQWPATANIPMQRPASFGTRATLTDEELAQRERQAESQNESDTQEFATGKDNVTINPPGYWVEHGKPNRQASLVVDPPDGRIPPMTEQGRKFAQDMREGRGPGQHF